MASARRGTKSIAAAPGSAASAGLAGHRVVVFLQENKTTDFYFAGLAPWGAAVRHDRPLLSAPPNFDQPHDRSAWVHYKSGDYAAFDVQVDTDTLIPFYAWLAKQHTFCDHHFGLGSNSTSGHMLAVGGQTPTLKNPPFVGAHPVWNLPTVFSLAQSAGVSWAAFPDNDGYPTKYYTHLTTSPGTDNIHPPSQFIPMAKAGTLPQICYVWSPGGFDEHPPATSNPNYVKNGHDLIWQRVQAVIDGGGWAETTFILTWDDWGGYTDTIATPDSETAVDALHPGGFQVIGGARIPLIMFGGKVTQGIDNRWHSHASIVTTIIDLLGLPPIGIERVDHAVSMADRIDPTLSRPLPPASGLSITQPDPPNPTPVPQDPPAWTGPSGAPLPDLATLDGSTIPAPADATVHPKPPTPPTAGASAPPPPPPPTDLSALVDKSWANKTPAELAAAPLSALKGLSAAKADALGKALGAKTIGELAVNKYLLAAQTITTGH